MAVSRIAPTAPRPLQALLCILLLAACQSGSTDVSSAGSTITLVPSAPQGSRTPIPQPPLPPTVVSFVEGLNEMPSEKYLFIEYWVNTHGISPSGICEGAAMIDFPGYSYDSGSLHAFEIDLSRGMSGMASSAVGFFGYGNSNSGDMGGGISSGLHLMETLPYTMLAYGSYELGILHGVDAGGNVTVEVDKQIFLLAPGQSWSQIFESEAGPDCHVITTYTLRNYGLLEKSNVTTSSDDRLEYLRRTPGSNAPYQLSWYDDETFIFADRDGLHFYSAPALDLSDSWAASPSVIAIALSPDKKLLAAADLGGTIQLWDLAAKQLLGEPLSTPVGPWLSLAFSPDGRKLASGSWDGIIQIWDIQTRQAIGSPWITHTDEVIDIAYGPNGQWLISSGGENQLAQIWQVSTGQAQPWQSECVAMALSPNGTKLACLETDIGNGAPTLYIADRQTQERLVLMSDAAENLYDLTFSPDGTLLAGGSDSGLVKLWNAGTGTLEGKWTVANGAWFEMVISVKFSPDGKRLAACNRMGGNEWTLWMLDLETKQTTQETRDVR